MFGRREWDGDGLGEREWKGGGEIVHSLKNTKSVLPNIEQENLDMFEVNGIKSNNGKFSKKEKEKKIILHNHDLMKSILTSLSAYFSSNHDYFSVNHDFFSSLQASPAQVAGDALDTLHTPPP